MYGLVNQAIEDMILMHHGESVWLQVKNTADLDVDVFLRNEAYPDEITNKLISAAVNILNVPAEEFLHNFGEHWILHTAQQSYGGLMYSAGRTLHQFLKNLPDFHARVALLFPKLQPPTFTITDESDYSLKLHYMSSRQGLQPFVVGLIHGLGKLFNTPVTVRLLEMPEHGANHDVFEIKWTAPLAG